jgi:hypothetical protein
LIVDGFAATFKEAVGRWRRRHRHPPSHEQWFAVHYRAGWLVEKLTTLESVYLLRQGLDVRPLAAERPPRKKGKDDQPTTSDSEAEEEEPSEAIEPAVPPAADAG